MHWGGNWGYVVPLEQQQFARALIDDAGVVHGHSSPHPKAVEVHRGKLILYGCGDLINDYEGISGHQNYRDDLRLIYLPTFDRQGRLQSMTMIPYVMRRFALHRATLADASSLRARLATDGEQFHTGVSRNADNSLQLHW